MKYIYLFPFAAVVAPYVSRRLSCSSILLTVLQDLLFGTAFKVAYVVFDGGFNVGNGISLRCIDTCTRSNGNTHQS